MNEGLEFEKRINDLARRSVKTGRVTNTWFLTPAEKYFIENRKDLYQGCAVRFFGEDHGCERTAAFFIPDYLEGEEPDYSGQITAFRIQSFYGEPGHRDYLGAILNTGIERNRVGDLVICESSCTLFCFKSVAQAIAGIERVGRCGVKISEPGLSAVPKMERKTKKLSFTVSGLRLDAVAADMFSVSRSEAAERIRLGLVSLNYSVCEKPDARIDEGDIISMRGEGKGVIAEIGGQSRKGRTFVIAEIFV